MTRRQTRQVLSDEAKRAKMEIWAIRAGLDKSAVDKMQEMYGPYAYELMRQAQYPGDLNKKTGYPYASTRKMLRNMLDDEKKMTTEQIAKAVGVTPEIVEQNLSVSPVTTPPENDPQQRFDEHVDERNNERRETTPPAPTQDQEQNQEQERVTPPTSQKMTLDDYVAHYEEGKGPLTGQALRDAAYKDFTNGEGNSTKLYVEKQNYGHPTIGAGCIVVHRDLCQEPPINQDKHGTVAGYKAEFRKQKLTDAQGNPLSNAQKDQVFEDLRTAVRNDTLRTRNENGYNVIISPASAANVRMPQQEIRRIFDERFENNLKKAQRAIGKGDLAKGQEIFNKYPKDLQLAIVHTYFAGKPGNRLTDDIKRGVVDPQDPMAMVDEIKKLRSARSEGNRNAMNRASEAEKRTREAARDSINYAQNHASQQFLQQYVPPVPIQPQEPERLTFRLTRIDNERI